MRVDVGGDVKDLYPTEKNAIKTITNTMALRYGFKSLKTVAEEDQVRAAFTTEAKNRLAEIGFIVDVEWLWDDPKTGEQSPDCNNDPDDMTLFWKPKIVVHGRTTVIGEIDHDRMKSEIVRGLDDGKAGVIRDGKLVDDPKSTKIYLGKDKK